MGGRRVPRAAAARTNALAFTLTMSVALLVLHLTGVVTSLELMPTGPPLVENNEQQHALDTHGGAATTTTRTPHEEQEADEGGHHHHHHRGDDGGGGGGGGGASDTSSSAAAAATRWERDMMSPAVYDDDDGVGGGGGGGGGGAAPPRMSRGLLHLEESGACVPGSAVTHETGGCVDCTAGHYASGRSALCRFPNVPFSCSSMLNPTVFLDKYGFNDQLAANCDFKKEAARLISGDVGNCSFADIGLSQCTPSATVNADDVVTFSIKCAIPLGDQTFQNCTVGVMQVDPSVDPSVDP